VQVCSHHPLVPCGEGGYLRRLLCSAIGWHAPPTAACGSGTRDHVDFRGLHPPGPRDGGQLRRLLQHSTRGNKSTVLASALASAVAVYSTAIKDDLFWSQGFHRSMYRVRPYLGLTPLSKEAASSKIMAPQGSAGEAIKTNPAESIGQMTQALLIPSLSQLTESTHGYTQLTTEALTGRSDWPFRRQQVHHNRQGV